MEQKPQEADFSSANHSQLHRRSNTDSYNQLKKEEDLFDPKPNGHFLNEKEDVLQTTSKVRTDVQFRCSVTQPTPKDFLTQSNITNKKRIL